MREYQERQPIVILGAGRSGSTVFHTMLSEHPQVTWLSGVPARYPHRPEFNRWFMRAIDLPWIGRALRKLAVPGEAYAFWDHYFGGFGSTTRDLDGGDLTAGARDRLLDAFAEMLTERRSRLLLKITGWPRVGYLRSLFPGAKFIHIVRDGRAVAHSFTNVPFWKGWRGPGRWRLGELPPEYEAEWRAHDRSFVALAAIGWKILMDAMRAAERILPDHSIKCIRYEDLCHAPRETFDSVFDFCELPRPENFVRVIRRHRLENRNDKWKTELTLSQQEILQSVLASHLPRFGYEQDA